MIFLRPDLLYHSYFRPPVELAANLSKDRIFLPNWQSYGGYNDRFAICCDANYVTYGSRASLINSYIDLGKPLYSELFLHFALKERRINIDVLRVTASRVRADGRVEAELFTKKNFLLNKLFKYKLIIKNIL